MIDLTDILKLIPQVSTGDLQKFVAAAEKQLELRKLQDLVEYVPDVVNNTLRDRLLAECNSMNFSYSERKACSQWLSTTNEPYIFPDSNPVHKALDIKSFPAICEVMNIFNNRFNANNDSCLILKYTTSSSRTSLHADDEKCLDQSQPICNLTIGSSRVIKFLTSTDKREVCSIEMKDKGVVVMHPGTQQSLLHKVQGDNHKTKALRYSISFRTLAKKSTTPTVTPVQSAPSLWLLPPSLRLRPNPRGMSAL